MREIKLILIGIEGREEIKHLVKRPVRFRVGLVHLVQDDDGPQTKRKRF